MNPIRPLSVLVLVALLSGCVTIKTTSLQVDGDQALPPPPVVPDSVHPGQAFAQMGIRLAPEPQTSSPAFRWNSPPVGGDVGVQYVASRRFRILAGASASNSASGWAGLGMNVRNTYLAWDFETLLGATWADVDIQGLVSGYQEDKDMRRNTPVETHGSKVLAWTQMAVRTRLRGSGPWLEARMQPGLRLGTLSDPVGDADTRSVGAVTSAWGGGWLQEFPKGGVLVVGARKVWVEFENEDASGIQGLASWVQPF